MRRELLNTLHAIRNEKPKGKDKIIIEEDETVIIPSVEKGYFFGTNKNVAGRTVLNRKKMGMARITTKKDYLHSAAATTASYRKEINIIPLKAYHAHIRTNNRCAKP